jgi:hypothetical protein
MTVVGSRKGRRAPSTWRALAPMSLEGPMMWPAETAGSQPQGNRLFRRLCRYENTRWV